MYFALGFGFGLGLVVGGVGYFWASRIDSWRPFGESADQGAVVGINLVTAVVFFVILGLVGAGVRAERDHQFSNSVASPSYYRR